MATVSPWKRPPCYSGADWTGWYSSGFGQSRDSDALERSNFRTAVRELQSASDRVEVVRESHWAVGWVEWIAIPADDHGALLVARDLADSHDAYPVLDEFDFSELELEEAEPEDDHDRDDHEGWHPVEGCARCAQRTAEREASCSR